MRTIPTQEIRQRSPKGNSQESVGLLTRLHRKLKGEPSRRAPSLRHVETLALDAKKRVFLLECDGRRFLVTGCGENISAPVPLTQHFAADSSTGDTA